MTLDSNMVYWPQIVDGRCKLWHESNLDEKSMPDLRKFSDTNHTVSVESTL